MYITKVYRVCYVTMFCDQNVANNTKIGVISNINYMPKKFIFGNNYIIYIDDNRYSHNININYNNGEIRFMNPDNKSCWGFFTDVYISNQ